MRERQNHETTYTRLSSLGMDVREGLLFFYFFYGATSAFRCKLICFLFFFLKSTVESLFLPVLFPLTVTEASKRGKAYVT